MEELDRYINQVKDLPPPPRVVPDLLLLLSRPNIDSSKVVRAITRHPGLAARVLEACNSAYLATAIPTIDLQEAVTRLGFKEVYQLVTAICGAQALASPLPAYGFENGNLWRHSVTAAVAAQQIARSAGENETLAFTAALLHDLGKIVLDRFLEAHAAALTEAVAQDHLSLLEAERTLLQAQHAETGGRLLERWNFPEAVVMSVWFHHHPRSAQPHHRLASCVYLGNLVAISLGCAHGPYALAVRAKSEALDCLKLMPDHLDAFLLQTVERSDIIDALAGIKF